MINFADLITKLKDILSLGARSFLVVAIVAWTVLLLPEIVTNFVGVESLRATYRPWIGAVALISTIALVAILVAEISSWGYKRVMDRRRLRKEKAEREAVFANLTPPELKHLKRYVDAQISSVRTFCRDGMLQGLVDKGIIYRATTLEEYDLCDYNIHPWAYTYLSENRELFSNIHVDTEEEDNAPSE